MSPAEAKVARGAAQLRQSVWDGERHWMMVTHNGIAIYEQRTGEDAKSCIQIPRRTFNAMMDWYLRDQHAPN